MIIHDCEQGTEEWFELRKGRLTGSVASKLLTPTGRESTQYIPEMARIIAEDMGWQEPPPRIETDWMARGTDLEEQARKWLSFELNQTVEQVGFISVGEYTGCSPDGIIVNHKGDTAYQEIIPVELKVPKPSTHIQWLMAGGLPKEHKAQVHFELACTRAPYAWFMSYHPECEPLLVKVERDEYTFKMQTAIDDYIDQFESAYKRITGAHKSEAYRYVSE